MTATNWDKVDLISLEGSDRSNTQPVEHMVDDILHVEQIENNLMLDLSLQQNTDKDTHKQYLISLRPNLTLLVVINTQMRLLRI